MEKQGKTELLNIQCDCGAVLSIECNTIENNTWTIEFPKGFKATCVCGKVWDLTALDESLTYEIKS